jgi:cytochrome c biogenesis protein CcmG/thiol:disulfide interchange protein DsbE
MRRIVAVLAVAAAAIAVGFLAFRPAGKGSATGRIPPPLPDRALTGRPVTLGDLRGRPTLVNFWAAWCGPCKREAPELARLARLAGGRAHIVGVDWNDDSGNARRFAAGHGWTYPLLSDPSGSVGDHWGIQGLPTSFVLDSRGRIVATLRGPQTAARFKRELGIS